MSAAKNFEEFPHGFTTAGPPVGAAIALETLEIITEPGGIFNNVCDVSPIFQDGLKKFEDHPLIGEARGVGALASIVASVGTNASNSSIT